jgi:AraC-like DNA-binding protein
MIMEPGECHRTLELAKPASFHVICLDPTWIHDLLGLSGHAQSMHFRTGQVDQPILAKSLRRLWRILAGSPSDLHAQEQLCICLSLAAKIASDACGDEQHIQGPDQALRRARDYLIDYHSNNVSLQILAEVAQLSPCHLIRSFSSRYAQSPHQFLISVRVARARDLIARGRRLSEVALLAGFSDQAHFCRVFKRALGLCPTEYLRMT